MRRKQEYITFVAKYDCLGQKFRRKGFFFHLLIGVFCFYSIPSLLISGKYSTTELYPHSQEVFLMQIFRYLQTGFLIKCIILKPKDF